MEKKVMIVGKDILGDKGFCMVPKKMVGESGKDTFETQLNLVESLVSDEKILLCTSMTPLEDLKELDYNYLPTIAKADVYEHLPYNIYCNVCSNKEIVIPTADFIIWDDWGRFNVMTYSKTAPILYFETEMGKFCLGTILRKSLMLHGEYFLQKLLRQMGADKYNLAYASIISCTNAFYDDINMRLNDYVKEMLSKNPLISEVIDLGISPENNPDICYSAKEDGNHVAIIY